MDYQELLLDLEDTVNRISGGINSIGIMTMELVHVSDPLCGRLSYDLELPS